MTTPARKVDPHTQVILDRYADRENIGVLHTPVDVLVEKYLSKVMDPEELRGKTILEIGAGCSQYIPLFMQYGCKRYYANDLIPERLQATRVDDPRYVEFPGDFRTIDVPEPVDIVFASLTMMLLIPMLDEFAAKIAKSLKPGGIFLSMDANYWSPMSVYRHFTEKKFQSGSHVHAATVRRDLPPARVRGGSPHSVCRTLSLGHRQLAARHNILDESAQGMKTAIQKTFAPFKTILPGFIWRPLRAIATGIATPVVFSRWTGHFKSSLREKAVSRKGEPLPWYTYPCIHLLQHTSLEGRRILEFGGGQSSL